MSTDVSPHEFKPLGLLDWLPFRFSRCRACVIPRWAHPIHCWMTARAIGDRKRYTWHEVIKQRFEKKDAKVPHS